MAATKLNTKTDSHQQYLLEDSINCRVSTRVQQIGAVTAFCTGPFVFLILGFLSGPNGESFALQSPGISLAIALSISILVPLVITQFMTLRDVVRITDDRLVFHKLGEVKFDMIEKYNVDDYLKLTLRSQRLVKLVFPRRPHGKLYRNFLQTFVIKMSEYQARRPHPDAMSLPQRTYFYGSSVAKTLGGVLLFLGILLAIITIFFLPVSAPKMFILAGLFPIATFGVVLLGGGRPMQTPEIDNSERAEKS